MKHKPLYVLLLLICLAGILFSGYKIYDKIKLYRMEQKVSQQMQQYIQIPATEPPSATSEVETTDFVPDSASGSNMTVTVPVLPSLPPEPPVVYPTVDFEALHELNPDIIGWIYIENTNVNYPILQGKDNREYVETMPNGWYNASGSIFTDYRHNKDFSGHNSVLYGHNMQNGSMFADIVKYKDPAFLAEHPIVMIMTPNGNFRYRVIAGYVASLSDAAWQLEFASDEDFGGWLYDTLARSQIKTDYELDPTDTLLTLSTCTYEFSQARYVLICAR